MYNNNPASQFQNNNDWVQAASNQANNLAFSSFIKVKDTALEMNTNFYKFQNCFNETNREEIGSGEILTAYGEKPFGNMNLDENTKMGWLKKRSTSEANLTSHLTSESKEFQKYFLNTLFITISVLF